MKFFIVENNVQAGPYTIEELRARNIQPSTLVWREGMADWIAAGRVPELACLFTPPTSAYAYQQPQQPSQMPCPKTWLVESILVTLFCCIPFGIVGIVYASQVSSKFAAGNYVGAAQSSANAKKWTLIGMVCGIIGMVAYGGLLFGGVFGNLNGY